MGERDQSLHVLQHALGLDQYGQGNAYRNHYVAGEGHHGWDVLMAHVDAGRMVRHGPAGLYGGDGSHCFVVTESGRSYVREHSPPPPKLTRAQERYRRWLRADCGMSFIQWLKATGGGRG